MRDHDEIMFHECDSCGERSVGTMLHCNGTPVLFLCARPLCGGHKVFERLAEEQKERWLNEDWRALEAEDAEIHQEWLDMDDARQGLPEYMAA